MQITRLNRGASLLALSLMIGSAPALAQDAAAEAPADTGGIADIVVTAQKRAENVQEVPIAISAVSSEYLESRGITSIDQLGTIAPNMKIERAPSNKTITQIAIRGSVTINPAITWEPAVGLYVDGVYIAKAQGSIFDIADLERVEVLRGPQGTLYGRNTLAGAVNLVTQKPSGELGGSAEITYGDYDYWKAKAILDLPQMGIFSAKVSGQIQKRDGFIKVVPDFIGTNPPLKDTNDLDNKSFMVQVRAQPSDNLTIDYAFDYSKFDQRPDYAQLYSVNQNGQPGDIFDPNSANYSGIPLFLYANKDRQSTATLDTDVFERTKTMGHALTIALDLGNAELKSITAYRTLDFNDLLDLDGSPLPVAVTGRDTDYHSFSQELQVTGTAFDDRLNYVAGLYYFKDKAETLGPQSFFFGASTFESDYGSHTEAYAAYAQADFKITEKLILTGGIRYTHEKKDIMRLLVAQPGTPAEATQIDVGYGDVPDAKYNDVSPAATLRYEITDRINVYARYAKGFKSGGFNGETNVVLPATAECPSGAVELCNPYKPEKVDSYEIGFKSRLLDNKLQLNLAAFWDDHKDIQLSVFRGSGAAGSVVFNAAAARIRGLELEWLARPADWFTVNGSFALLDAKYKSYLDGGQDVADNRAFPHTPKYSASLGMDWRVVEGDWGRFNLISDLSYVSKYYTYPFAIDVPNPSDQTAKTTQSPGRTIVNLRGVVSEVPLGGVEAQFSLWVKNLFKENNPQNFIDFGPSFGGLTVAYYPDPRTFGITAGIKF
ncbi:TonB-dependent receptor [Sphingomonas sp. DBB INV C78]|uniref:TonB-dependent receptor n=1 Tax=Sphingomonas sp. DBB INV C78 TaxID=3349434 RepID=UPI0036D34E8F